MSATRITRGAYPADATPRSATGVSFTGILPRRYTLLLETQIPLAQPDIGPLEEAEVLEALRSRQLGLGPKMGEFERLLATFTGAPWARAVSSGTAGLHLAVRTLGIGEGDCVPMSSFSFISSANAVRYEHAEPVFLDIEEPSLCLSPAALRAYLETCDTDDDGTTFDATTHLRVAAVITTDVFGHPVDMDGILGAIGNRKIAVISDSCEALGSRSRRGDGVMHHAGHGADLTVFAFYPNKQITTGEGGMVTGTNATLCAEIESLRNQGRAAGDPWLRHTQVGFNYRLDDLSAALGVAQMRRIDEILGNRARVAGWYRERLADLAPAVRTPVAAGSTEPAWFVEFLRVDPGVRQPMIEALLADGVQAKAYFDIPIHRQPPYDGRPGCVPGPLPVTEDAAASVVVIPFFSTMSEDQVAVVSDAVHRAIGAAA